ncbi:MAG: hypothetical protein R3F20_07540 [Planctomycetota bacterium]
MTPEQAKKMLERARQRERDRRQERREEGKRAAVGSGGGKDW